MTSSYSARERFGTTLGLTQNNGGPGQIRTADLRFRKPSLYPSELQGQKHFFSSRLSSGSFGFAQDFGCRLSLPRCAGSLTPSKRLNLGNRRSIHLSYRAKTSSFF